MSSVFFEARPLYTQETPYTLTATVEGSGSLTGDEEYAGFLYAPDGTEIENAVAVEIADEEDRTLTITVEGQDDPGTFRVFIRRTDDESNLVVVKGDLEITDPSQR